jgi:uncharacterized SAM-dependent methyltransferase
VNNQEIQFKANEAIYMEISQKYSENERYNGKKNGFEPLKEISDSRKWFVDAIGKLYNLNLKL